MAIFDTRGLGRTAVLAAGVGGAVMAFAVASPSAAGAADLTCTGPAGSTAEVAEDGTACGVRTDNMSTALARAYDAVAFARAEVRGSAFGLAHSGGVAAAETSAGHVGAVSVGPDSVSIVSTDPGAIAFALSLTRGQTFVGTTAEGVRCDAGAGVAVNFSTGQMCISDGSSVPSQPS
ncbi:MAG: DUF6764 family protein [Rhodococcus sp. (in: high G+C Gram-positive bacteria)]